MTARDQWVKPTTDQIVTALDQARELIRNGWTQRQAHAVIDGRDCYDGTGAVAKVSGTIRLSYPVMWGQRVEIPGRVVPGAWLRDAVTAVLMQAIPRWFTPSIAAYNDQPDRTRAEMVALFNTAISIAKREVAA